jgi:hypothetical protein
MSPLAFSAKTTLNRSGFMTTCMAQASIVMSSASTSGYSFASS